MEKTRKLIERFLDGQCTAEESELVAAWLKKDPAATSECLIDDWQKATAEALTAGYEEDMLQAIRQQIFSGYAVPSMRRSHRFAFPLISAAATILLAMAGILLYKLVNEEAAAPKAQQQAQINLKGNPGISPVVALRWEENKGHQNRKIILADGSSVSLSPESRIGFPKTFASAGRQIFLQGEAVFDVARDDQKPFTVRSGKILTTVLGTRFSVRENNQSVLVKLYSGKVKVQNSSSPANGVLLKPGEQFRYEILRNIARVSSFRNNAENRTSHAVQENDQSIGFDHAPLSEVMDRLSKYYQVPVDYNKQTLSNMFFSGTVLKTDSLSVVLRVIAHMNGLQLSPTNAGYMLQPSGN
ncbi:MAG TPA: FecR domain-containing protein [Puia sp.]|nr:FecR domain-containing protein [Puia sp.]